MKKITLTAIFIICTFISSFAQIGTWRAYMAYHEITDVQKAGNRIYVLASNNLYYYNTNDNSITLLDKTNSLSDCTISQIAWCQAVKKLIVIYENGNIDLLKENDEIENISDYKNKNITGDKTINGLYIYDKYAYMATGFGIVKINMKDVEISDTYNLGFNVNYVYIEDNNIYAASKNKGIYSAPLSTNLLNPNTWEYSSEYVKKSNSIDPELLEIISTLQPGGPISNSIGYIKKVNDTFYTCNGDTYQKEGCIQTLKNGEWSAYQGKDVISNITGLGYTDIKCLDVDPNDATHLFAGARNGLYEFRNGEFVNFYNSDNSPIEAYNGKSKNNQLVTSVLYDKEGNLWLLNSQAPTRSIIELTKDGEWINHDTPELMKLIEGSADKSLGNMIGLMADSRGLFWFVNNHYVVPSLYCYNPSTNTINCFTEIINQDEKNIAITQGIRCVTEDNKGNIWIGTDTGPFMLRASDISAKKPNFIQVKVPRNDGTNFADYLLAGVDITAIAVDGAGRKWFGSNNGAYLISEDNMIQLEHFDTTNSSIISNNITSISIDHTTGEVFFATDKGLCSYTGDATKPNEEMTKDNVYAYPNPVTPDYTGMITVIGLSYNSDVKIVTVDGTLVASGTSNGGTFQWDGNDMNGKRVASGIYNVVTAKQDGSKGTVCKIAIIN